MVALLKGIMCRLELFSINQWHFKIAYTVVFLRLDSRTYLWKRWKTMFLQCLRKTWTKGFYVDRADTTTTTTRGEMFCIVFNLMLCIRVCVSVWLVLDKWLFWNVMKQLCLYLCLSRTTYTWSWQGFLPSVREWFYFLGLLKRYRRIRSEIASNSSANKTE